MKAINGFVDIWKKMMNILTPSHKRWGIVVFVLSILGSIAEMLGVSIILPLVQVMLDPEALLQNRYVVKLCNWFNVYDEKGLLVLITAGVVSVYIFKNIFLAFLSYVRVKYSLKVQRELSLYMFDSYMDRGYNFFRMTNYAVLARGVSGAVSGVQDTLYQFFKIFSEVITILCIMIYVAITDWKIMSAMLIVASVCMLIMFLVFRKITQKAGEKNYYFSTEANKWMYQLFCGIKEVLVMQRKDFFLKKYKFNYIESQKASVERTLAAETPAYIIEAACVTGLIMAVCARVMGMEQPSGYIAQLASFAVAAFRVLPSLGRITSSVNAIIFQVPAVNEFYENKLDGEKVKSANDLVMYNTDDVESEVVDRVGFKNIVKVNSISYHYPDGISNVLENVCLEIKKGECVAFVGPSGGGKTTLADIILGVFKPQKGNVEVDGIDIDKFPTVWSRLVGFVPQSVYLLDDTIRRNVAFGVEDSSIVEEKVWRALEKSQMASFVKSLPDGLDTVIGDRGVRFSGGQAQRLAIARALYHNPEILVFDEATSALDNETERAVMDAIESLQGEKTMIIIAHRLSTVEKCDKIYEIKDGCATLKEYKELIF